MQHQKPTLLVLASTAPRWHADHEPRFVLDLCCHLTAHYEVILLAPHCAGASLAETLEGVHVRRYRYWFERWECLAYQGGMLNRLKEHPWRSALLPIFFLAQILATARLIRQFQPQLIHAHWLIPQGLAALIARRLSTAQVPILCTSHGADLFSLRAAPFRWLKRLIIRSVDGLTVVSNAMAEEARRLVPACQPAIIPMGVDLTTTFTPPHDDRGRNTRHIVFVGRLVEKKGVTTLLQAFRTVLGTCRQQATTPVAGHAPDLLVLGVHRASEGYPNVLYRLRELRESGQFAFREINVPFWRNGLTRRGALSMLPTLARAALAHATLVMHYLNTGRPQVLYVPYPAISVLVMLSLLPQRYRPKLIVADAFISIYDTVVNDRRLLSSSHPLASLIRTVERRAYTYADIVVADTPENAIYLRNEFRLPQSKVRSVPLSSNETQFRQVPYKPKQGLLQILFVGTLVPLHGATTIIEAAALLKDHQEIAFKLIGDGQEAGHVEQAMCELGASNITWIRAWQTPESIAEEIENADICLGIFGNTAKAQRVCPLKLYAYATVGRPIITAQTSWLRHATAGLPYSPFATVPAGDSQALASRILELLEDLALRTKLAEDSRRFYEAELSNLVANERFLECLKPIKA